jgi:hypothetical protein
LFPQLSEVEMGMEIGIGIGIEIAYSHLRDCQSSLLPGHHLQELHDLGILRATPFLVGGGVSRAVSSVW